MEKKKRFARAAWVAGICVAMALAGAVLFLRSEILPEESVRQTHSTLRQNESQLRASETEQVQQSQEMESLQTEAGNSGQSQPPQSESVQKDETQATQAQTQATQSETIQTEQSQTSQTEEISESSATTLPSDQTEASETLPSAVFQSPETQAEVIELSFPCELESGTLVIHSVFQFSGMNPDADLEPCEDVASIQIENISSKYLVGAQIILTDEAGEEYEFYVEELPAGASAMAFCVDNTSMSMQHVWTEMSVETEFANESPAWEDRLQVEADFMQITLTNVSGEDLVDLEVYCHNMLNESCFGGSVYCYELDELPAGGSAVIDAVDCFLDGATVVRIEDGN